MLNKRVEPTCQFHKAGGQARSIIDGKSIDLVVQSIACHTG